MLEGLKDLIGLETLTFDFSFNKPITRFDVSEYIGVGVINKLTHLKTLTFGDNFNQDLDGCDGLRLLTGL
jgi:hypothetical protein